MRPNIQDLVRAHPRSNDAPKSLPVICIWYELMQGLLIPPDIQDLVKIIRNLLIRPAL